MTQGLNSHPERSRRVALLMNQNGHEFTPEQVELLLDGVCHSLRIRMQALGYEMQMTDKEILDFTAEVLLKRESDD